MPNVLAGLDDRVADLLALLVGAPDLEPGRASHAMPQCAHLPPGDVDLTHVEELDVRRGPAVQLLDHVVARSDPGSDSGTAADDGLPIGRDGERSSYVDLDVVAAGLGVELDPVGRRRATDEHERWSAR